VKKLVTLCIIADKARNGLFHITSRKLILSGLLTYCFLMITQCALRPIPRDLATYINRDIQGIRELEQLSLERYAGLTGKNFISDASLQDSLAGEIIPTYSRFLEMACRVKPQTEPVKNLHALFQKAAMARLNGFRLVSLAIESQDPNIMSRANISLNRGQVQAIQWKTQLSAMAREYDLELN
jgi:hypothetical protein